MISGGLLVPAFAVVGQLLPDGTIELTDITIEFSLDVLDPPDD